MSSRARRHGLLITQIAAALLLYAAIPRLVPVHRTWGDEPYYVAAAHRGVAVDELRERYESDPKPDPDRAWSDELTRFFRRLATLNSILLAIAGLALYRLALGLGASTGTANLAVALTLFNPRVLFFLEAAWPEILHLALLSSGMAVLVAAFTSGSRTHAFGAGLCFGLAALTKGIVGPFLVCAVPVLVAEALLRRRPWRAPLGVVLSCLLGVTLCLLPQALANHAREGMFAIATNKWINLEVGLIPVERNDPDPFERYMASSTDPRQRERLARERVVRHLQATPPSVIVTRQLTRLIGRQLNASSLRKGLRRHRWAGKPGVTGSLLASLVRILSWAVLLLGLVQIARSFRSSVASVLISTYIVYYLASLLVVGFNSRFFIQVYPFLALFCALELARSPRPATCASPSMKPTRHP